MSTEIKLSKAQVSKLVQSGRFLGAFLGKLAGPLIIKFFGTISYYGIYLCNRFYYSNKNA